MNPSQPSAPPLSPLKQALLAVEQMQARLEQVEATRNEPIAVIGVGCRLPGEVDDAEAFWALLRAGRTTRSEVPAARWDVALHHDPDPTAAGKVATRFGNFLGDIAGFDAEFFGISPREAACIDPQHRVLAEVAWEALEDAGVPPASLVGTRTGVYAGIMSSEYAKLLAVGDYTEVDTYYLTGNQMSFAAGRISYLLGLQGPCMAIDTACSSSLVAVHQACRSLRAGECDVALAGGVSLVLTPELSVALSRSQVMAPDGQCKTFDADADGLGRGEGAGMVVLRRLSDAQLRGDRILCVIRGSAVNHDGASGGLTVPSGAAQEALLRAALADAAIEPERVGYHEAHGTGTRLGDLIETRAIAAVHGVGRAADRPLRLGALKANIGHLDAAAGIAGLIKAALIVDRGELPPHPTLRRRNEHVPWDSHAMEVPTVLSAWPEEGAPRVAGVSAFGLSGINAHVVLEQAPATTTTQLVDDGRAQLLVVSARSPQALRALATAYAALLQREGGPGARAVAAAAALRREHHEHRLTVVGATPEALADGLAAYVAGREHPGVRDGRARSQEPRRVVFVCPGQGSQWHGMGRRLWAEEPAFRAAMDRIDPAVQAWTGWSPSQVLTGAPGAPELGSIAVIQPTLFAMSVALAALWRAWGIEPAAVVGHSMGEVAAACIAGALSLEDGARIICERSRLMRQVSGRGGMAVVELGVDEIGPDIATCGGSVAIAAQNGPRSTVLSGDAAALDRLLATWQAREVFGRRVKVDVASHSPQVDPLLDELRTTLRGLSPRTGAVPLYSTVTGAPVPGAALDPAYWVRNLREPVRFAPVIERLLAEGHDAFIELSPHPVLLPFVAAMAADASARAGAPTVVVVASLRREQDERASLLDALAELHVHGAPVDWRRLHPDAGAPFRLPAYPWQRRRHWLAARRPRTPARHEHPLLGARFTPSVASDAHFWEAELGPDQPAWLGEHRVQGVAVLPGAAGIEMALAAADAALGTGPWSLVDVAFSTALGFLGDEPRRVQVVLTRTGADDAALQLASRPTAGSEPWVVHFTARVEREASEPPPPRDLAALRERCDEALEPVVFYAALERQGLGYGPIFQGIEALRRARGESLATLRPASWSTAQAIHPAVLDAGLQAILAALPDGLRAGGPALPVGVERVRVCPRAGDVRWSHVKLRPGSSTAIACADIELLTADGSVALEIVGLRVQRLLEPVTPAVYTHAWHATPLPVRTRATRFILIGGAAETTTLAEALTRRSATAVQINAADPDHAAPLAAALRDGPIDGVVHLPHAIGDDDLGDALAPTYLAALRSTQALARAGLAAPPRLWLVSRRVHAVDGGSVAPVSALVWGLGRTVAYEHPELRCSRVDLDDAEPGSLAEALATELTADAPDEEIALTGITRHVARIARRSVDPDAPVYTPRADATYLITGGLGGLGLAAARWLVEAGARHLVLVGRAGVTTTSQVEALAELAIAGAHVVVERADLASRSDLERVLAASRARMPALRGVIHAAGVLSDAVLADQDDQHLRRVLGPKALGAWNLHLATQDDPLDFFALYSSASSLFGSPGQANYAAANAFVDALAAHRHALGRPALAIQWGAFAEVGLAAASPERGARLAERGMGSLDPADSGPLLAQLLAGDDVLVGVAAFDVHRWVEYHPQVAGSSLLAGLLADAGPVEGTASTLQAALLMAPDHERPPLLESFLREQVAQVLRLDATRIETDLPLKSHGVDSLMAIELKNRVHARLGVRLPVVLFLQGTTLRQIGAELLERWNEARLIDAMRTPAAATAGEWEEISL